MRRCICFCLIIIFIFCITGCDKQSSNNIQATISSMVNSTEKNTVETKNQNYTENNNPKTYSEFREYNDGLAWVKYIDDSNEYYGCIDESGKMLFRYNVECKDTTEGYIDTDETGEMILSYKDDTIILGADFENNYSYLKTKNGGTLYVIDKNGDVCSSYNDYVAFGYGYTVVENHYTDFDSEYYEYSIYDSEHNCVNTVKFDEEINVKYCGEGVFDFDSKLFFSQNEKMIDYNYDRSSYDKNIKFYNGIAYVENDCLGYYPSYIIITATGTINELENIDGILNEKLQSTNIYSNSLLIYEEDTPKLATYNVNTQSVTYLKDESVLQRLETHYDGSFNSLDISPLMNEKGIILRLVGDDGFGYVIISDYEFNFKTEPIKYDECKIYKNGICEIDSFIYDMEGNQLFSLFGYEEVISDSKDVLMVCCKNSSISTDKDYYDNSHDNLKKSNFVALSKDGKLLFDSIDTLNVIDKNLF